MKTGDSPLQHYNSCLLCLAWMPKVTQYELDSVNGILLFQIDEFGERRPGALGADPLSMSDVHHEVPPHISGLQQGNGLLGKSGTSSLVLTIPPSGSTHGRLHHSLSVLAPPPWLVTPRTIRSCCPGTRADEAEAGVPLCAVDTPPPSSVEDPQEYSGDPRVSQPFPDCLRANHSSAADLMSGVSVQVPGYVRRRIVICTGTGGLLRLRGRPLPDVLRYPDLHWWRNIRGLGVP
ncbi:unnamed protein product [Ranitomeya imitator]|uniref:Uncharacterized protein n=1 Tax=Ranitomeya imitator TaxID=111125 RepID=A0ABN9M5U4_9NEOB|nr:unnamed protein product [Ranitomeya imitator]